GRTLMRLRISLGLAALSLGACTGVKTVQIAPPVAAPAGMIWGYGTEKLDSNATEARQSAYLRAMADLLTRGPVLVSGQVEDRTVVLNTTTSHRTMESSFRLRASRVLQPSFMQAGVEDGYVWVLVAATEVDIRHGWEEFLSWRA